MIAHNRTPPADRRDDLPADFGWVLSEYTRRLRAARAELARRDALAPGVAREIAQLDVDEAHAALVEFRDEMAAGWLCCARLAFEVRPADLAPLLYPSAAAACSPYLDEYRRRVERLERLVDVLTEEVKALRDER